MELATEHDIGSLARQLQLSQPQVQAAVELLEDGLEIPFIARYCLQQTQGFGVAQLRAIRDAWQQRKSQQERKEAILALLRERDQWTPELEQLVQQTRSPKRLEDIFLPFKRKKTPRIGQRPVQELEPFVEQLLEGTLPAETVDEQICSFVGEEGGFADVAEVRRAVHGLLVERFCEHVEARQLSRAFLKKTGVLTAQRVEQALDSHAEEEAETRAPGDLGEKNGGGGQGSREGESTAACARPAAGPAASEGEASECEASEAEASEGGHAADELTDVAKKSDAVTCGENGPAPAAEETGAAASTRLAVSEPVTEPDAEANNESVTEPVTEPASEVAIEAVAAPTDGDGQEPRTAPAKAAALETASAGPRLPGKPKALSAAEERRRKRRESRHRRRALLEASFRDFFDCRQPLLKASTYQLLALARGERVRALQVAVEINETQLLDECLNVLVPSGHPSAEVLLPAAQDAVTNHLVPELQREVRQDFTARAEQEAATWFCEQLSEWLLQQPLACRVLAIDPGLRYGCKVAALDAAGRLLAHTYMHATGDADHLEQARRALCDMVRHHKLQVIAIGNGAGHRDAEKLVLAAMEELQDPELGYAIVNQAGAFTYAKSGTANQELPEFDTRLRVAISIGRRLQDPLAELVKIPPSEIGIGPFRNDVKFKHLSERLQEAVSECVAQVGVHLNAATPSQLNYVPGIDEQAAAAIYNHREKYGGYGSLAELCEHGLLSPESFRQAAGFLVIPNGINPLDGTRIHPERYDLAEQILERAALTLDHLRHQIQNSFVDHKTVTAVTLHEEPAAPPDAQPGSTPIPETSETKDWHAQWRAFDVEAVAQDMQLDPYLVRDIVRKLDAVGRDPRDGYHAPIIRHHALKLDDLQPGVELAGIVVNVAPFGVFVDVGLPESGLIHISRLANRFVSDPHDVFSEGDVARVWVVDVDRQRRRIALTAIPPGTEKPRLPPRSKPPAGGQRRFRSRERDQQRSGASRRPQKSQSPPRRRKPRPAVPITDAMKQGREPMRTFSDLKQFYEDRNTDEPPPSDA